MELLEFPSHFSIGTIQFVVMNNERILDIFIMRMEKLVIGLTMVLEIFFRRDPLRKMFHMTRKTVVYNLWVLDGYTHVH